ncbi:MAG: c-type cytochrome, partial [Steroidobacteraceae bacterium]
MIDTRLTRYALGALLGILLAFGCAGRSRAAGVIVLKQPAEFGNTCAVCHGSSAEGTERGPSLVNNYFLRGKSTGAIADIITHGRAGIMPSFANLPGAQIEALATYVHSLNTNAFESRPPGDAAAGAAYFFGRGRCSACHIAQGRGGIKGPDLSSVGTSLTLQQLVQAVRHPQVTQGSSWTWVTVMLRDGSPMHGFARNRTQHSLDLQTADGQLHPLTDTQYRSIIPDLRPTM